MAETSSEFGHELKEPRFSPPGFGDYDVGWVAACNCGWARREPTEHGAIDAGRDHVTVASGDVRTLRFTSAENITIDFLVKRLPELGGFVTATKVSGMDEPGFGLEADEGQAWVDYLLSLGAVEITDPQVHRPGESNQDWAKRQFEAGGVVAEAEVVWDEEAASG